MRKPSGLAGFKRISLTLLAAATAVTDVAAQVDCVDLRHTHLTSRVFGQVFDDEGRVVPGAYVVVYRRDRRLYETETDERGFFHVAGPTRLRGEIRVSVLGFASETSELWVEPAAPSRLLAVRLAIECGSEACSVDSPQMRALDEPPPCLYESPSAARRRKQEARIARAGPRCAAGDRGACRTLTGIAERDEDSDMRVLAANALSDQTLLLGLVAGAKDWRVRAAAVRKIDDQRVVVEHATGEPDEEVRAAATAGLADHELLARIAVSDASELVRAAAVRNPRLTDQALLAEITRGVDTNYVRAAAVARLRDPVMLRPLVASDVHQWLREAAVSNPALDDQPLFAEMARIEPDLPVRDAAFRRITDPGLRQQATPYVDAEATRQVSDAERLLDIARQAGDPRVRSVAAARITDATAIAAIFEADKDDGVRMAAVLNPALTDQTLLAKAARFDTGLGVRVKAASRLDDQVLAQRVYRDIVFSQGWGRWHYAIEATGRITDQSLLARIATTDQRLDVRREATRHLEDQSVLGSLAVSAPSPLQRIDALTKLTDLDLLRRIAADDGDWFVRKTARERVRERGCPLSDRAGRAASSSALLD